MSIFARRSKNILRADSTTQSPLNSVSTVGYNLRTHHGVPSYLTYILSFSASSPPTLPNSTPKWCSFVQHGIALLAPIDIFPDFKR